MLNAAPGLRYRRRVSRPPSRTTGRGEVRLTTTKTLDAASTAHTTDPIKRATAVYRFDLITPASTTACYGPRGRPKAIAGVQGAGATPPSRDRPILAGSGGEPFNDPVGSGNRAAANPLLAVVTGQEGCYAGSGRS